MSECDLLDPHPGRCDWCSKPLKGRQMRWCSRKCSREFTYNHRWTQARQEARQRVVFYQCEHCLDMFPKGEIEVNHIVPCRGKHSTFGCHHHQENLEVLCKPCHQKVTNDQRKRGFQ